MFALRQALEKAGCIVQRSILHDWIAGRRVPSSPKALSALEKVADDHAAFMEPVVEKRVFWTPERIRRLAAAANGGVERGSISRLATLFGVKRPFVFRWL